MNSESLFRFPPELDPDFDDEATDFDLPEFDHELDAPSVADEPESPPSPPARPAFEECLARFQSAGYAATDAKFARPDTQLDATAFRGSSIIRSSLLRGALFSASVVARYWCDRALFPLRFARDVRFTGFRLYQHDLSLLLCLGELLAGHPTNEDFDLDVHDLIHGAGWPRTSRSKTRLAGSLMCLAHAQFELRGMDFNVTRFRIFDRVCMRGERVFGKLSGGMVECQDRYGRGTYVPLERRKALSEGLQSWLAGWVLATKCDEPVSLTTLLEHSGSGQSRVAEFGREIRRSLDRLQAVGIVSSWTQRPNGRLERNLITIRKHRLLR